MLGLALGFAAWTSRRLGFSKEDEITIVFCGSKKSLASGVPMAKVLFAPSALGMIILPLMLFHQIQLMGVRGAGAAVGAARLTFRLTPLPRPSRGDAAGRDGQLISRCGASWTHTAGPGPASRSVTVSE